MKVLILGVSFIPKLGRISKDHCAKIAIARKRSSLLVGNVKHWPRIQDLLDRRAFPENPFVVGREKQARNADFLTASGKMLTNDRIV